MLTKIKQYTFDWNSNDWIISYLLFVSFFNVRFAPIGIIALLISSLFFNRTKNISLQAFFDFSKPTIWMFIFYIYHFVGIFWSSNLSFAWSDIGMKASFALFPIAFFAGKFNLTVTKLLQLMVIFLSTSVILLLLFAVFQSIYYPEDNHWGYFFESEFSCLMHRSYFANYTAIGTIISFYNILTFKEIKWNIVAAILLFTATMLTLSKAGLVLIICSFLIMSFWILIKRKSWIISATIIGVLILIVMFFSLSSSSISARIQEIPNALRSIKTENNTSTESNAARIVMWSTSLKLIAAHPFLGSGTGDVKDELIHKNLALNNIGVAEKKLNAHNQFLNSWVQLGLLGFASLIIIFYTLFRQAIKDKNMIYFLIYLTFFLSFLFESFVETQAGIIPFCLIISLMSTLKSEEKFSLSSSR